MYDGGIYRTGEMKSEEDRMKNEGKIKQWLLLCLLIAAMGVTFTACSDDDDSPGMPDERYEVMVLFPEGGLGDQAYNDNTLRGMEQAARMRDIRLTYFTPEDDNGTEEFFRLLMTQELDRETHLLLVLAGSEYEEFARSLMADPSAYPDMERKTVLLFEAEEQAVEVHTFKLLFYNASYAMGELAARYANRATVLLGNSTNPEIQEGADGFCNGFRAAGGSEPVVHALADNPTGFVMPAEAYRYTAEWVIENAGNPTFIYPLAGGSSQGVYRYARENEGLFRTAGMDVDQSALAKDIVASVVKHTDRIICQFLVDWRDGKELPKHSAYDVESGMIELVTNKTNNK